MKSESKRAVIKTARQRLQEWQSGICPYCGTNDIMAGFINDGRYRALCLQADCATENYFSGPMVKRK
jgi:hypothetical protein